MEPNFCLFSELLMNQLNTSHCSRSSARLALNQITIYVQALKFQTQSPQPCTNRKVSDIIQKSMKTKHQSG